MTGNKKEITPEAELIQGVRHGSQKAITELYNRHFNKIKNHIAGRMFYTDDAFDVVTEAFLKVVNAIKSHKYQHQSKFLIYFKKAAMSEFTDYRKLQKRWSGIPVEEILARGEESVLPYENDNVFINARREHVLMAIEKLDTRKKAVLIGYYYEGRTLKEIAETMEMPHNTAKGVHQKALRDMKEILKTAC